MLRGWRCWGREGVFGVLVALLGLLHLLGWMRYTGSSPALLASGDVLTISSSGKGMHILRCAFLVLCSRKEKVSKQNH